MGRESITTKTEKDPDFEELVNYVVENFGDIGVIRRSITFEERAKQKGSAYKLRVLNEALRRVTIKSLPELRRGMEKEAEERKL